MVTPVQCHPRWRGAGALVLAGMALLTCGLAPGAGAQPPAVPLAHEPGADAVRNEATFLADPALAGRSPGTDGSRRARRFLIERLRRTRAKPAGADGYEQSFVTAQGDTLINLVAVLPGTGNFAAKAHVLVGAHYDHLGVGAGGTPHADEVFPGADDNASGVAALLDIARRMDTHLHDVMLVFFDGEEQGRLGSLHYVEHPVRPLGETIAMINLDTVGRLADERLTVFGVANAAEFEDIVKGVNMGFRFQLQLVPRGSTASDDASFLQKGVPALHLFSGANADYHRPSDTADKLNAGGLAKIAEFATELARYLADRDGPLAFVPAGAEQAATRTGAAGAGSSPGRRVTFGCIPDFQRQSGGVLLTGVIPGSPAEQVGMRAGDVLLEFAGTPVDNLVDYSDALKRHAPGDQVEVVYLRGAERRTATITLVERK